MKPPLWLFMLFFVPGSVVVPYIVNKLASDKKRRLLRFTIGGIVGAVYGIVAYVATYVVWHH